MNATSPALGLAVVLLSGCIDTTLVAPPGATDAPPDRPVRSLGLPAGYQLQRPKLDLAGWVDLTTSIPVHLVTPEAATNIGTGSAIIIDIPNEGRFGCTANFVWKSNGKRYLGAAGHCFVPAASVATHGPDADYDASGVTVDVCVQNCDGNFRTNQLVGQWVRLGQVAYARQADQAGEGVGNDFGVVEIPREFRDYVRLEMPVWGGPSGVQTLNSGDYGCHYGHGLVVGETVVTKARVGVGGGSDASSWMGAFAGAFGDSGSGMVGCVSDGTGFHGTGAIGILTHLGVALDETTGEAGVVFGTTIQRAIEMAEEARLKLSLATR